MNAVGAPDRSFPAARPAVTSDLLVRPDWTAGSTRDPALLRLDKNENTDPDFIARIAAVVRAAAAGAAGLYSESPSLYRKLAAHLGVAPRNLLLAAGSDGVIRSVFAAYVTEGDTVLMPAPTFAMVPVYARMVGARAVEIDYRAAPDGPVLLAAEIVAAVRTHRPKLVYLANPDSPTGAVKDPDDMAAIIGATAETGTLLLVDEAYHPFHDQSVVPLIAAAPHLVVCRSASKAWGCAGLRIGYGVASPEVAFMLHKVRPMYEVGTLAATAFERVLDLEDEMRASVGRLLRGKQAFLARMDALGLKTLHGGGNFLHVAFGARAERVHAVLAPIACYRRDFDAVSLRGFSRFTTATVERLQPVIDTIEEVVKTLPDP